MALRKTTPSISKNPETDRETISLMIESSEVQFIGAGPIRGENNNASEAVLGVIPGAHFSARLAGYIVRPMRILSFMEQLLAIEAETKYLLAASDRSYEQKLMNELLRIFKEAELLFGPRDVSYKLSTPRITECATSRSYIFPPLRTTRIYLSRNSRTKPWTASVELAHEAIHVLSPAGFGSAPTILEEGLAEWFAQRYVNRVHGLVFERGSDPKADAVMQSVSTLLATNESVIRNLRTRQPVISKIDEKLLVEVAGIEISHAKFLCTDFQSYWRTASPLSKLAAQGADRVAACLRSIWKLR